MIEAWVVDWAALVLRWFHFMMGVAWIGASFYFVWLNNAVRPREGLEPGVAGEVWSVHGGAFYQVQKYAGAPAKLPEVLHWFKWEAYLTWLSGFLLLVVVYWWNAATWMVDPAVAELSAAAAVGMGVATLVGGWAIYDGLCRSPLKDYPTALAASISAVLAATSWGLFQVLAAKAAYVHTGAMIGTWMAGNVLMVIIPGQRAMVDAMVNGREPPLERGKAGALRSLHNNYLTLPVLFVMISGHFPQTWGRPDGWAVLLALAACGALYRHHANLEERGHAPRWILPTVIAGLLGVGLWVRPAPVAAGEGVPIGRVQQIIGAHCLSCHAREPFQAGITVPPKGLVLDTPDQIVAARERIVAQVVSGVMPLGNLTGMTDEERAEIARWGAR